MPLKTVAIAVACLSAPAFNAVAQPVVALHAVPRAGNTAACGGLADLPCSSYSTEVPGAGEDGAFVYMVVARGDEETGVSGVSFAYDISTLAAVEAFILCADSQSGAQSGSVLSWNPDSNCQRSVIGNEGVHAVAGVFMIGTYGPSFMSINPNQETEPKALSVIGCDGSFTEVAAAFVTFGPVTDDGFNPCSVPVPARTTTWGRVKALIGR